MLWRQTAPFNHMAQLAGTPSPLPPPWTIEEANDRLLHCPRQHRAGARLFLFRGRGRSAFSGQAAHLWLLLNTALFAQRAVRIDATLNRMIAGTAREYLEFVIAAAVGARAPPDYPHTFAAMLTDWIANPLLIQHDTNAPQLTQHSTRMQALFSTSISMSKALLSSGRPVRSDARALSRSALARPIDPAAPIAG